MWWIRVSPSSFFVLLLYACRVHGRGKDTGVRAGLGAYLPLCLPNVNGRLDRARERKGKRGKEEEEEEEEKKEEHPKEVV